MSFSQATDYKVGTIPLVLDNRPSSPEMECTERKTTRSNPTGAGPSRIAEVREQQIDPAPCTLFSSSMGSFEVPDAARHRIEEHLRVTRLMLAEVMGRPLAERQDDDHECEGKGKGKQVARPFNPVTTDGTDIAKETLNCTDKTWGPTEAFQGDIHSLFQKWKVLPSVDPMSSAADSDTFNLARRYHFDPEMEPIDEDEEHIMLERAMKESLGMNDDECDDMDLSDTDAEGEDE